MKTDLDMNCCTERLTCTDDEKREALKTVRQISYAYEVARKEGILAIEFILPEIEDTFLSEALGFIVNDLEYEVIIEAMKKMRKKGCV